MPGLADFIDSLLRGVLLASLALTFGGVAWGVWGLRAWKPEATQSGVVHRCAIILGSSALVAAGCQATLLGLLFRRLTDALGPGVVEDFLATGQFAAGAARTVLALAVAAMAGWLARRPARPAGWVILGALSLVLAVIGGVMSHAWARLHYRALFTTLTILHQLGGLVWAGALVHLASLWPLARRNRVVASIWPEFAVRFSRLAIASVLLLVLAGAPLAWMYAGSAASLLGTGFGSLILAKCLLLSAALLLGAFNFAAARAHGGRSSSLSPRAQIPYLVEAEAIILGMVLFAAVALSAQPPGADLSAAERAEIGEVAEVFRPKLPSLRTPSLEDVHRKSSAAHERSREAYLWSNFSHNVAGLILLPMSLVALVGSVRRAQWAKHWPLGFLALAAFVYLRAAASDEIWPFGGFALSDLDAETLQHLLAAVLVLALGLFECWARSNESRAVWSYVFPLFAIAGGALLLTHSHTALEPKPTFLVQVTHSAIGTLAGLVAAGRWLELRLPPPGGQVAGAIAGSAMVAIALVLVFYREANVVIPE
ncbi:MAG: hypothetical protein C5B48_08090 [Candidatus Rokuibacteriota bacterium]|nr:MAG: hypothetical protein C5B48_08090 [Candidatus Rokubacteria bacterium]